MGLFVSCSTNKAMVSHDISRTSPSDVYQIPADAPVQVAVQALTVPRISPFIQPLTTRQLNSELEITQQTDSLGLPNLRINRPTRVSWEIVESAIGELEWNIVDRDRRNYTIELDQREIARSTLARWFGKGVGLVDLVLIPQGDETLVVLEARDDSVPDVNTSEQVLTMLYSALKPS